MSDLHELQAELRLRGISSNISPHNILSQCLHLTGDGFSAVNEKLTMMPGIEVMFLDERREEPERFDSVEGAADYITGDRRIAK